MSDDLIFACWICGGVLWITVFMLGFGLHDDLQKILRELQKREPR